MDLNDIEGTEYGPDDSEHSFDPTKKFSMQMGGLNVGKTAAMEAAAEEYLAHGKTSTDPDDADDSESLHEWAKKKYMEHQVYEEMMQYDELVSMPVVGKGTAAQVWLVDGNGNVLASEPLKPVFNVLPGDTVTVNVGEMLKKVGLSAKEAGELLAKAFVNQVEQKKPPTPGPVTNVNLDFNLEPHSTRLELVMEWTYTGSKDLSLPEAFADLIAELANSGNLGLAEWLMEKVSPGSL